METWGLPGIRKKRKCFLKAPSATNWEMSVLEISYRSSSHPWMTITEQFRTCRYHSRSQWAGDTPAVTSPGFLTQQSWAQCASAVPHLLHHKSCLAGLQCETQVAFLVCPHGFPVDVNSVPSLMLCEANHPGVQSYFKLWTWISKSYPHQWIRTRTRPRIGNNLCFTPQIMNLTSTPTH